MAVRNLIYSEFGLDKSFRFDAMSVCLGMEDLMRLTTPPAATGTQPKYFSTDAVIRKLQVKYNAEHFEEMRQDFVNCLARLFECPTFDLGMGFPSSGALKDKAHFDGEDRRDSCKAKAIAAHVRVRLNERLEKIPALQKLLCIGVAEVTAFPMPYHQTGEQWTPTEQSIGRLAGHQLNFVGLCAQEFRLTPVPFYYCPGTPG